MSALQENLEEPVNDETAVAVYAEASDGTKSAALWEIGTLSDQEFDGRMAMLRQGVERVKELQRSLLEKDVDWGKIPGVKRDMLFKSGAERLGAFYRLVPRFVSEMRVDEVPMEGGPLERITFTTHCYLHHLDHDGPVVGEGIGVCSTFEKRYLYRSGQRTCPECGEPTVRKGKPEYGGGWYCDRNKGGCGNLRAQTEGDWATNATRAKAAEIDKQAVGDVLNRDPWDMANTIAKMSEKRSHTDAIIRTLGVSGLFTQDEDSPSAPKGGGGDPYGMDDWNTDAPAWAAETAQTRAQPPAAAQSRTRQRQERAAAKGEAQTAEQVAEAIARSERTPDEQAALEQAVAGHAKGVPEPDGWDDPEVEARAEGEKGTSVSLTQGTVVRASWDATPQGNPYVRAIVKAEDDLYYHVLIASDTAKEVGISPRTAEEKGQMAVADDGNLLEGRTVVFGGKWTRPSEGWVVVADGWVM